MEHDIDLEAARAKYPLPEQIEDRVVNRTLIAKALDTTTNSITEWVSKGMPCLSKGSNGRDYEFQISDCYAWRMAYVEADALEKKRDEESAAQTAMLFINDEGSAASTTMSPKEARAHAEAQLIVMRAGEMRGELVRREHVRLVIEDILDRIRTSVLTLPDYAEREFGLTPEQVQKLERRGAGVLTEMRGKLEELSAPGQVLDLQNHAEL